MSSENGGESRAAANQEPTVSSDNAVAVGETTNSTLPKKNNQSISDCIGKHTKANQKGEELPFYEAANIIYRPGGKFFTIFITFICQNSEFKLDFLCVVNKIRQIQSRSVEVL